MEDQQIIDLYFARSEDAIAQTHRKYGKYCHTVAYNILFDREDTEECVSDTYLKAWNAIPPRRPNVLKIFLGKMTRNLALDRFAASHTQKRGGGETPLSLSELAECIPDGNTPDRAVENKELIRAINDFLAGLPAEARKIFLMRYWNMSPVRDIAAFYGLTESKVKVSLMRTRGKLRDYLEGEGIAL